MTTSESNSRVSAEDIIAFNDELAALVRNGLSLEAGLEALKLDGRGGIRELADVLAAHLQRGEALPEALSRVLHRCPEGYRALLEAGLRMGDLPAALELVSESTQRSVSVHRRLARAIFYPLLLVGLTYALFVGLFWEFSDRWLVIYEDVWLDQPERFQELAAWVHFIQSAVRGYWWAPPAVLVVFAWWWNERSRRLFVPGAEILWVSRVIPGMKQAVESWQYATFATLLAALTRRQTPLPEALTLSGEVTGDRNFQKRIQRLAADLRAGQVPLPDAHVRFLPPYLRWLVKHPQSVDSMIAGLRQAADLYWCRSELLLDRIQTWLPPFFTLVIGGSVALLYAIGVLGPMVFLWYQLFQP